MVVRQIEFHNSSEYFRAGHASKWLGVAGVVFLRSDVNLNRSESPKILSSPNAPVLIIILHFLRGFYRSRLLRE